MLKSTHSPFVSFALKAIGRVFGFDRGYLAILVFCCGVLAAAFGSTLTEASSEPAPHLRTGTGIQKAANLALLTGGTDRIAPGNGIASFFPNLAAAFPLQLAATNEITIENALEGSDPSEWDVSGAGDASIQGFATNISVDQGGTVDFKIDTPSNDYRIDIYRLGWYGGSGARKVATVEPSATLPQSQPACLEIDGTTNDNLIDCGNWGVSASWTVPTDAVSGIYIARPVREDGANAGRASHIVFIVRDDDGASDILFQTSDTTWQAYNRYGGYSLYAGPGHAHKVSYNRPFTTRAAPTEDWVFNAEYPMLRWLERNGYDVSYFTDVDSDRNGTEILEHKIYMSVGHDEYWSAGQRAHVENARDAGVNLAFFSGNEIYWKTRWEASVDGSATPYRTLVSYKEGGAQGSEHYDCQGNFNCDPHPTEWTGLWRQNAAGHDAGRPENSLSGQISWGDATAAMQVPASAAGLRFWRNTGITGATTLEEDTLGYEFDWEQPEYASSYPAGRITLSDTTLGGKNHKMSLYRAPSGALVFGAGTVQWSWGLDGTHDRGASDEDPRMQQATVNLLSDMGVQPGTLQSNLVEGGPLDTAATTVSISEPTAGATVSGGAVFVSGTAQDIGGTIASVEVSTDGGTTWSRASGTTNWTHSFSASDGEVTVMARAVDDSVNIGSADSVTFIVGPQECPCTIFVPAVTGVEENDNSAVELGVKFRSDTAGFITGIRFYKTSGNTGTHTGRLWNTSGTVLGTVTFGGESATGWQEAAFDQPIAIQANTTYVASYHTTSGRYAIGTSFASAGADNPPLHALQNGVDGPNGVYLYGAGGIYPTDTFGSSNYLVDVVFVTSAGPDTTAPTVIQRSPASGASGVGASANITAQFSEPINAATISGTTFQLKDSSNSAVSAAAAYDAGTRTATLNPNSDLQFNTTYTATVKGGAGGVTDTSGNALAADVTWTFTTGAAPPPPPDEGPGGPVLVISSAANPFSRYYAEILRAEGLNAFTVSDISNINSGALANYDVVILGEMGLSSAQVSMLTDWVNAGGNLIAMKPDPQLASLLGLSAPSGTLAEGYLLANTAASPGAGIVNETIQFHGTADLYSLNGAASVAALYSNATTSTPNPAVTLNTVGLNGGQAAAFTYDLARSVVYTRQGNPAWAGQERDGQQPPILRSDDMFFPDWVNLNKVQIPQADEQQRLLANLIQQMNRDRKPLPRFWYFPRGEKAVVIMTGDDHGSGGTDDQFAYYSSQSPQGCNVNDWECIRATSYIYPGTLSASTVAGLETTGFEIALHVNTNCSNWTPSSLDSFFDSQLATFSSSGAPPPTTNRNHCITWSDWATLPKVELDHGIRLDTNYYYWPAAWLQDRPGMFTGSGMPMRFADLDGTMIDVYQATTQMTDESGMTYATHIDTLLDNAIGAKGYYGAFTMNMHTDNSSHPGGQTVVAAAKARGVPVVSARQMLNWLDGRNGSSFENLAWSNGVLSFSIAAGTGSNGLQAMLPTNGSNGVLQSLTRGGNAVNYTTETIKGIQYAVFPAQAGNYAATYAADTAAPTVTVVSPENGATGVSEDADAMATFSEAINPTTVGSSTFELRDGSNNLVPAAISYDGNTFTIKLDPNDPLANATTYTATIKGGSSGVKDATGTPLAADHTWSFKTAGFVTIGNQSVDTNAEDFEAGTKDANTYIAKADGGEVILNPSSGSEFDGAAIPSGWAQNPTPWSVGGTVTVSAGQMLLDGRSAATTATFGPGTSLEFVATFSAQGNQHIGFVNGAAFNDPWIVVSTGASGNGVFARSNTNTNGVSLGSGLLGTPHRYRIVWTATGFEFYVDGATTPAATIAQAAAGPLNVVASDFNTGTSLSVDWARVSPYAGSGTFTSRIHDAGDVVGWQQLNADTVIAGSSSIGIEVRGGNTPTPDGTWSAFAPLGSGNAIALVSRYLQYRAVLNTTDTKVTPELRAVTLSFGEPQTDTTPPTITARSPLADATSVAVNTTVSATFSEAMDPTTINSNTFTLRAAGGASDVPATVNYASGVATLTPDAPLAYATAYTVTVGAGVTDAAGNQLGTADSWNFTTETAPRPPANEIVDNTVADFTSGTLSGTYIANTAGGELTLNPTVGAEFDGNSLPVDWQSAAWNTGGTATVASGNVVVNGAYARTTALYGPGRAIEFRATFNAGQFQNAGLAFDLNDVARWAVFGIGSSTDQLYARVRGSATEEVGLGALLGTPHVYRIEWEANQIRFYVDGSLRHTSNQAITEQMRPIVSDFPSAAPSISVDWMRMSPYGTSGSFISRVLDAGENADWLGLINTAQVPSGASVSFETRSGNAAVPDQTWSDWQAVSSGTVSSPDARYTQYRASLTTTSDAVTPALEQVTLTWLPSTAPTPTPTPTPTPEPTPTPTPEPTPTPTPQGTEVTEGSAADFAAGSSDGNIYISQITDGEVALKPAVGEEFSGSSLPNGWGSSPWNTGGTSTVASGVLTVNGARTATDASFGPGRSIEFVATFGAAAFQHVGFGNTLSAVAGESWAMFSTGGTNNSLLARINNNGSTTDFVIPGSWLNAPHRYRIEWNATNVVFYIDGNSVRTFDVSIGANMRPVISDLTVGGPAVTVDWLHMSPYASTGTFTSQVIDAGSYSNWVGLAYEAETPTGTSVSFETRSGNTPVPDGTWSAWESLSSTTQSAFSAASSDSVVSPAGRYFQYRTTLTTTSNLITPRLGSVTLSYENSSDPTPTPTPTPSPEPTPSPSPSPSPTPSPDPTPDPGERTNYALASNGGRATASSTIGIMSPDAAINGDRKGLGWGTVNGGWEDNTPDVYPDLIQVEFSGPRAIGEINVFTIQDNYGSPSEPTDSMTFNDWGITAFDVQYWNGSSWQTVPNGSVADNNNVWRKFTFSPVETTKIRVVVNNSLQRTSRIIEVEAWGEAGQSTVTPTPTPDPRTNYALASNGGTASASSTMGSMLPSATNNGDRKGLGWGTASGGWEDSSPDMYPDVLQIDFAGAMVIEKIDVFTIQDNYGSPMEPAEIMTFTQWGITAFDVQYWNGSSWQTVPNGSVADNDNVWRKFTFSPVETTKIRVVVNNSLQRTSRIIEVEAWGEAGQSTVTPTPTPIPTPSPDPTPDPRTNYALASNGGTASASSTMGSMLPSATNNGDRKGLGWGTASGGWEDNSPNIYPDGLRIDFSGPRTIDEIDVFTIQDNYSSPAEPTESMTFTEWGITAFEVQYWDGSAWQTVPNGSVTNNNNVWRKFTFSPVVTSAIKVVVNNSLQRTSRVIEVEAWGEAGQSTVTPTPTPTSTPNPRTNYALAANGGAATGSSTMGSMSPGATNNEDRKGLGWGTASGGWEDATPHTYPDVLQIDLDGVKAIDEINVFTIQDNYGSPSEPTESMTFTEWGITAFEVQYWDGSAWQTVPNGSVTNNNKVWNKFTFSPVVTSAIRVVVSDSLQRTSRIIEVEAWGEPGQE